MEGVSLELKLRVRREVGGGGGGGGGEAMIVGVLCKS